MHAARAVVREQADRLVPLLADLATFQPAADVRRSALEGLAILVRQVSSLIVSELPPAPGPCLPCADWKFHGNEHVLGCMDRLPSISEGLESDAASRSFICRQLSWQRTARRSHSPYGLRWTTASAP